MIQCASKYTHGGIPEAEALHWNKETYQRLGKIIFHLTKGDAGSRRRGYIEYHEFHRHFMKDEWESKIRDLEIFRAANGNKSIADILSGINQEFIGLKTPQDTNADSPDIPEYSEPAASINMSYLKSQGIGVNETIEQMSLF